MPGLAALYQQLKQQPEVLRHQGHLTFQFKLFRGNYGGLNTLDAPDNIPQGEEPDASVESPDLLDVYSYPLGAITSFFNSAKVNATAIATAPAISGMAWLGQVSAELVLLAGGKFWEDVAGVPTDRTGALTLTSGADNLMDSAVVGNAAIFADRLGDAAWKQTGAGTNGVAIGGTPPTPVYYTVGYDRRAWLFDAQKGYYSAQDNVDSGWDTVNGMLPFETNDGSLVTCAKVHGDSIIVGKEGPAASRGHVFRVFRTGDPSIPYDFEEIPTGGVGPISQQACISKNQDFIFPAKDGNVYVIRGNRFVEGGIGKKIKPFILTNFNKNRFQYASAGIIRERNMLGISYSLSGITTHARGLWYDYENSTPGQRDLWYLSDHVTLNAWIERVVLGQHQLVTGDYAGFYHQHLTGSNFSGTAFTARRVTPWHHLGSQFTVKNIIGLYLVQQVLGTYALTVEYALDFSANWKTARTVNVAGGATLGTLVMGTDVLGGKDAAEALFMIMARARRIRFRFSATSDNPFAIYAYGIIFDPMAMRLTL